ncbi:MULTISPECIES: hypothetical protein [Edwardsiella]|uniref:Uncharacterized protein n=2 Tax=Edwardsiella anguillarum TaxID=1821960 RepID=A0A076LMN0_9GAMM|nr:MULTISPECIES: hypothetical protein [Edwardsiella]AIJ09116.1 Hypothetical protein ETEE_2683 [Edwardsiella anguillarum ET080813]KAB0585228.1 hypothetical protein F7P84_19980 [Edwardsiella anguillarum]UBU94876.1 hypothetical protein AAZ33_18695 [Edwardsiella sp. LADL05-105]UOU80273.1 hypothetical protein MUN71_06655 [Edwardsiella anguillarum]WHP84706.1 hypothetical protein MQ095_04435 [Edwardsiella anguillarum]
MLVNYLMLPLIESICWEDIEKLNLPYELNEIVEQGFVELHGCFFSKKLFSYCNSVTPDVFEDEIAFECFVNSIHIEDYVNEKYLQYSIVFCNAIIKKWNENYGNCLSVIVSLDDETLLPTIKFHLKRKGVSWLDEDNLDSSIQAVLVTTNEINKNRL